MNKTIKYGFLITGIIGFVLAGFIIVGFHSIEIEDHYGNLQEFYYKSESNDIIVNRATFEFGIIEKSCKRINIRTQKNDSTDLYNWIYKNGNEAKVEIYRPLETKTQVKTYSEIIKLANSSDLKLITKN